MQGHARAVGCLPGALECLLEPVSDLRGDFFGVFRHLGQTHELAQSGARQRSNHEQRGIGQTIEAQCPTAPVHIKAEISGVRSNQALPGKRRQRRILLDRRGVGGP